MRLLLLILLLIVFQSHAQKTIDVKEKILAADKKLEKIKKSQPDSVYIDSLISVGKQFFNQDLSYSKKCLTQSMNLSKSLFGELDDRHLESMHQYAILLDFEKDFIGSMQMNQKTLDLRIKKYPNGHIDVFRSMNNLANEKRSLGDLKGYEKLMIDVIDGLTNHDVYNAKFYPIAFDNLSYYYQKFNRVEEAFSLFDELANIQTKNKDLMGLADTQIRIGILFNSIGDDFNAIETIQKSIETLKVNKLKNEYLLKWQLDKLSTIMINVKQFNEAEVILEELKKVSKNDLFYLGASYCGLSLVSRINGNVQQSKKFIHQLEKEYSKSEKLNSIEYAECFIYLGQIFGINNFDDDCLNFTSIGYEIYKTTPGRNTQRFYNVALEFGTSLQNTGNNFKAIEIYEDIKKNSSSEFLESNSFYILCTNLAGSYSNVKDLINSTAAREEGFQFYFKHHISNYWDDRVEKDRDKQLRDLNALGNYNEMQSCLEKFRQYYVSIYDILRQVDCYIELSNLNLNNFYSPYKAKQYLDSANLLMTKKDSQLIQNARIKYLEADILRRQGMDLDLRQTLYSDSYSLFENISNYDEPYFKFCAFHLAEDQLLKGNNTGALQTIDNFTLTLCNEKGENSFDCLNSRLKQIEFLSLLVDFDSLSHIIDSVEIQFKDLLETQYENRIAFNNVKRLIFKEGSIEERSILIENYQLSERNSNFQNAINFKAQLAKNFFITDSIEKGLALWKEIFISIDQIDLDELKFLYKKRYAGQLSVYNIDIKKSILIYENETPILKEKDFESYDLVIDTYLKANELVKAHTLIQEKEDYLKKQFNYDDLIHLYKKKLYYFELLGDQKNLLRCYEELLQFLKENYPVNSDRLTWPLIEMSSLLIKMGNPKKAMEILTDNINDHGWTLNKNIVFNELGDSTIDFVALHMSKIMSQFNYNLINRDYKSLNNLMTELKLIQSITDQYNPLARSTRSTTSRFDYKEIKEFLIEGLSFEINLMSVMQGESIDITKNDINKLLEELNSFKNTTPEFEDFMKNQIVFLLDYYELDDELYEFSVSNNIPLEVSFYERKGLYSEADIKSLNLIKSEILEMNKSKFLLADDEQLALKQRVNWSLNTDLLSFVAKIHYTTPNGSKYNLLSDNSNDHRTTKIKSSEIYELVLNSSGSILENKKRLNKEIKERADLKVKYEKWKDLYQAINTRQLDSSSLSSMKDSISKIERYLFQESGLTEAKWLSFSDIQQKLKDSELFIHTVRIYGTDSMNYLSSDSVIYLHFVADNKLQDPLIFAQKMNSEKELELSYKFKNYTQGKGKREKDLYSYGDLFGFLNEKNLLTKKKRIMFIPDGIYHEINLAAIFNPNSQKYFASEFQIDIFDVAGKLASPASEMILSNKKAVLVGSPNFDLALQNENTLSENRIDARWIDSLTRGGLTITPLPATKKEVEKVSESLLNTNWNVALYSDENASELTLKQINQPGILHIATHGYFLEDVPLESYGDSYLGMNRERLVEDPMLRSGLLLAGANKALKENNSSENNGIFSAFEASLLDLTNTELVVLSACETGKGEIKNSEGVYGLRKAFADAGAKNVIMSLWKVDDKVTQEFMTRFYEIWLNEKTSIREAFNKTQLEIMAKYPEPYYWGAFILVEN